MYKKLRMRLQLGFILSLFFFTHSSYAQTTQNEDQNGFGVGSKVNTYPKVQWIKGESVTKFDKDKTYIIECWATWCGPCRAAMPHLNELHKKYGDKVIIIGQNVFENNLTKVKKFVAAKGDGMLYRVAYSGGSESDFSKKWLKPAGIESIPQTIVIQDNKIIWMADPTELSDVAMKLLINKEFTEEKLKELTPTSKMDSIRILIFDEAKYEEAVVRLDKILEDDPDNDDAIINKSVALNKAGQIDKALAFLEKRHKEKLISGVEFMLYTLLKEDEQYDKLVSFANKDIDRAFKQDSSLIGDIIAHGYEAYVKKKDYQGLVSFINRISKSTVNTDVLTMFSIIGIYYPITPRVKAVDDAIFRVATKLLKENQINFHYLALLAQMFWEDNEKEYAKTVVNASLKLAVRDNLPENNRNALKKLLEAMNNGEFPTEKQLSELMNEANK